MAEKKGGSSKTAPAKKPSGKTAPAKKPSGKTALPKRGGAKAGLRSFPQTGPGRPARTRDAVGAAQ